MGIHKLGHRQIERLLAAWRAKRAAVVGKYADGGGLYLRIEQTCCIWVFRYRMTGQKERAMSLGSTHTLTVEEARERARQARIKLLDGVDPMGAKAREGMTFATFWRLYWAGDGSAQYPGVKQTIGVAKTLRNWEMTIDGYAMPVIGDLQLDLIEPPHIVRILSPLSYEVARKVRGRIERVLDCATSNGLRFGDNPARESLFKTLLQPKAKVAAGSTQHHEALHYADLPQFMAKLRAAGGSRYRKKRIVPLALEWLILTGCRTGDILGQTGGPDEAEPLLWEHIVDQPSNIWVTPRTKNGLQHLVPLCERAVAILDEVRAIGLDSAPGDRVFPMGRNAMFELTRSLDPTVTAHGFRATFKTWASEEEIAAKEVVEAVLAHGVTGDKVEVAYMRGDFITARKVLLERWADFIDGKILPKNVIRFAPKRAAAG